MVSVGCLPSGKLGTLHVDVPEVCSKHVRKNLIIRAHDSTRACSVPSCHYHEACTLPLTISARRAELTTSLLLSSTMAILSSASRPLSGFATAAIVAGYKRERAREACLHFSQPAGMYRTKWRLRWGKHNRGGMLRQGGMDPRGEICGATSCPERRISANQRAAHAVEYLLRDPKKRLLLRAADTPTLSARGSKLADERFPYPSSPLPSKVHSCQDRPLPNADKRRSTPSFTLPRPQLTFAQVSLPIQREDDVEALRPVFRSSPAHVSGLLPELLQRPRVLRDQRPVHVLPSPKRGRGLGRG